MEKNNQILKQLMVGDWVADEYGNTAKIEAVDRKFVYADFRCYGGDILRFSKNNPPQPIPLTPEILMKNGMTYPCFASEILGFEIYSNRDDYGIYFQLNDYDNECACLETYKEFRINASDGSPDEMYLSTINRVFGIRYVYELQHALRLCGLGEMADNFKV